MSLVTTCVCNEQFYNETLLFVSFINAFFEYPWILWPNYSVYEKFGEF